MISAGQNYGGVNPYGAGYSRRPSQEEKEAQRERAIKKLNARASKKIDKYKKDDPLFKKTRICPVLYKNPNGTFRVKDFGELCRGAKEKLDMLLPNKPHPSVASAARRELLPKVKKEELMLFVQGFYLRRYLKFRNKSRPKELLKILKANPEDRTTLRKYNRLFWTFLIGRKIRKKWKGGYWNSLQAALKRRYVLLDGKVYQKPSNIKTIRAKSSGGLKAITNTDMQCFSSKGSTLEVYEDCTCAVEGGDTECEGLLDNDFPKKSGKPAKGMVRARIFFNPNNKKLRLIPEGDSYAPPKGFAPISLASLKIFLSRHKDKSEGGKKLILDFLRTDKTSSIFRNDDDHYVVDVKKSDFLVYYNAYNDNIHKGQVFPAGIWLSDDDAKIFYSEANRYPPLRKLLRVNPFRIENTAYYPKLEDGKKQRLVPKDQTLLEALYEFADAIKNGKVKSKLSKGVVTSLHSRLKSLCAQYLERKWRKDITKKQWSFTKIMQIIGSVAGLSGAVISFFFMLHIREQKKFMVDPESEKQKLKEAGEAKMRAKRMRRFWFRKKFSWLPGVSEPSSEDLIQAKRDIFESRRAQSMREISTEEKEARVLLVNGEETFEVERDILRNYPHWIVAGWDDAIKKYHAAISRPGGEGAHPLVVGHSRSGKSYVHIGAFNFAAVDWLYRNEKDQVEAKLKEIFVEDKKNKARWEKYAKEANEIFRKHDIKDADGNIKQYPETGEKMVEYVMNRYKQISESVPEEVHGRKSGIPDPAKMQAGTEYRGAQAGKQAKLLAAGEKGFVHNFQEVYEALQQGKTRDGAPESMGNLLKHAMGLTSRSSFATGIRHNINVSADTTGVRGMTMARDQETRDFNGRWYWIPIKPWNAKLTLEVMLDPSWREPYEAEMNTRLSPAAIEAGVRLSNKLDAPGGSGMIPRLVASRMISDAIARQRSQGVRGLFELTEDHVVDLAKENLRRRIEGAANDAEKKRFQGLLDELTRDSSKFGNEVMELPAEHSMTPDEVRAYDDILKGNFGEIKDKGKLSKAIEYYLVKHHPRAPSEIYRLALIIADNETIGDESESTEMRITRSVSIARKLEEILRRLPEGDPDRPAAGDAAEWNSFVNRNLEKVMPRTDTDRPGVPHIQNMIMRVMTPYKYHNGGTEPDLAHMADVARTIQDRLLKLAGEEAKAAFGSQVSGEALVGNIVVMVENFEAGKTEVTLSDAEAYNRTLGMELDRYEAAHETQGQGANGQPSDPIDPARAALEEMLERRGIRTGTVEYYLATKFMDADRFDEREFAEVVKKAAEHVRSSLPGNELSTDDVDKVAKDAIEKAVLEVRGPGNAPMPLAPKPRATKPKGTTYAKFNTAGETTLERMEIAGDSVPGEHSPRASEIIVHKGGAYDGLKYKLTIVMFGRNLTVRSNQLNAVNSPDGGKQTGRLIVRKSDGTVLVDKRLDFHVDSIKDAGADLGERYDQRIVSDVLPEGFEYDHEFVRGLTFSWKPDHGVDPDPDKGPKTPGGRGPGGRGPTGRPRAPRPPAPPPPKPAFDGDAKASARSAAVAKYVAKLQKQPEFSSIDPSTLSQIAVAELNKTERIATSDGKLLKAVYVRVAGAVQRRTGLRIRTASKRRAQVKRKEIERREKAQKREETRKRDSLERALERLQHPEDELLKKAPEIRRVYRKLRVRRAEGVK